MTSLTDKILWYTGAGQSIDQGVARVWFLLGLKRGLRDSRCKKTATKQPQNATIISRQEEARESDQECNT